MTETNKTEKALKAARDQLATVTTKLEQVRGETRAFETRLNDALVAQAEAESKAQEAVAARENTVTAQVDEANLRATLAESREKAAKTHDQATIDGLREEVKDLQIKLFRIRDAVKAA